MSLIITPLNGVIGMMTTLHVVYGTPMDGSKNIVNGIMITVGNITVVFSLL